MHTPLVLTTLAIAPALFALLFASHATWPSDPDHLLFELAAWGAFAAAASLVSVGVHEHGQHTQKTRPHA
jgi:hypothetical protein